MVLPAVNSTSYTQRVQNPPSFHLLAFLWMMFQESVLVGKQLQAESPFCPSNFGTHIQVIL